MYKVENDPEAHFFNFDRVKLGDEPGSFVFESDGRREHSAQGEDREDPARYGLPSPCSNTMDVIDSLIDRDGDLITHKMAWHWATAMKYLMRWPRKGRANDLRKCADYIEMLIEDIEGGE